MKTDQEIPVLQTMLALFRDGAGWTKNALTRAADGRPVPMMSEDAHRFCLAGAAFRAVGWGESAYAEHLERGGPSELDGVMDRLVRATGLEGRCGDGSRYEKWSHLAAWNNTRATYGEIQAALRAALEDGK